MDFGDRLKELIEDEGLSPSMLADEIGVNRSGISHIINGRNKPGYDFMHKLRECFPDWNYDWLFFGEGKKNKVEHHKKRSRETTYKEPTRESYKKEETQANFQKKHIQYQEKQIGLFDDENDIDDRTVNNNRRNNIVEVQKKVVKTILIYNDGTFEIFSNKN